MIDEVFRSERIYPKEIIDVYFNTAAVRLAEVGIGVALLSEVFIKSEIPKKKVSHIRISGDLFAREICLVRKHDAHMSESARYFYEIMKEMKK